MDALRTAEAEVVKGKMTGTGSEVGVGEEGKDRHETGM